MGTLDYVLGGILIAAAVFLVIAVLMQQGKSKGMGAVGGGSADTFFGKTKGKTWEKTLSKLTTIIGIIFVVIVLIVYIKQRNTADQFYNQNKDVTDAETTTAAPADTTATPDETTATPDETTTTPDETTTAPDETTAAPDETTTAPDETTTAPDETTATTDETTAA